MTTASGLIRWSTRYATVGLVVADGQVVDAPPYARTYIGRDAREVWRIAAGAGAELEWIEDDRDRER